MAITVVHLHPAAPAKPEAGAACNGCDCDALPGEADEAGPA